MRTGSILVLGPARGGHRADVLAVHLAAWPGPAVVVTDRVDLVRGSVAARADAGRCLLIGSPIGETRQPLEHVRWEPLSSVTTMEEAGITARALSGARGRLSNLTDGDFWLGKSLQLLQPLLYAASLNGLGVHDVRGWIRDGDLKVPRALLLSAGETDAAAEVQHVEVMDERTRGSILATLHELLHGVHRAKAPDPDVPAIDLLALFADRANTLYLHAPLAFQEEHRATFVLLLDQVLRSASSRASSDAARSPANDLLLVLGDGGRVALHPHLDDLVSGDADGVEVVSAFDDLSQLTTRYGTDRARTLLSGHDALVLLGGLRDPALAEALTALYPTPTAFDGAGSSPSTASEQLALLPTGSALRIDRGHAPRTVSTRPPRDGAP